MSAAGHELRDTRSGNSTSWLEMTFKFPLQAVIYSRMHGGEPIFFFTMMPAMIFGFVAVIFTYLIQIS